MRGLALAALAFAGCSNLLGIDHFTAASDADESADAPMTDAPVSDGPLIDGPLIDAPLVDAPLVDAPLADASPVDARAIDARPPDAMVDAMVDAGVTDFSITLTGGPAQTPLGTTVHYTVTVTSIGLTGMVTLAPEHVPPSWTASVTPGSLALNAGDVKTADLAVTIPTMTMDLAAPTLGVVGSAGVATNHDATVALDILNYVVVIFADGIGAGPHNLPPTIDVYLGAGIHIVDQDTVAPHEVHGPGGSFPHQATTMTAGQEYDVTPTIATTYQWYCHVHGTSTGTSNFVVH